MPRAVEQDILLDTAAGRPIRNVQAAELTHPLESRRIEASIVFPSFMRASTNPRYNCHGLTFASRRTAILDDAEVTRILEDDGYGLVPSREVRPGDVAIYFALDNSIDHSAIVVAEGVEPFFVPRVCSKWGPQGPEVIHPANVCDYAIEDIRYYRVRHDHAIP